MSEQSICIGKIIEITNTAISVMLTERSKSPYKVINGEPIRIGGVGDFVRVSKDIYEIVNVKTTLDNGNGLQSITNLQKVLICNLCGYFDKGYFIQGNSGSTPNIFENVYTITDEQQVAVYAGTKKKSSISAGKYLYADDLEFRIDINKFFASHILIVGNTGSGKSNSLNTLYSNLFAQVDTKESQFIIIDTNGEYENAFCQNKDVKHLNTREEDKNEVHIPLYLLESEDWKLLLEATDKTQFPIVKKVWEDLKKELFVNQKNMGEYICGKLIACVLGILNSGAYPSNKLASIQAIREDLSYIHDPFYEKMQICLENFECVSVNSNRIVYRDGNVYDDIIPQLVNEVKNYHVAEPLSEFGVYDFGFLLNLEHLYRTFRYNANENNTSPMIARFNTHKKQFSKIFTPFTGKEQCKNMAQNVFQNSNIVVCDVSSAAKDIRRIIVTFICGKLYAEYTRMPRGEASLHMIVDEAHNYLSQQKTEGEDAIAKTCIETFEGIIKEGRKFGVFLTMSTQRPSDITGTLLSQAHNYVIHKLVNPRDIEIIKNTVPFIDAKSISMLSILSPGQAIFSGTAFNRPNIIRVEYMHHTKVDSQTINLLDHWKRRDVVKKKSVITI